MRWFAPALMLLPYVAFAAPPAIGMYGDSTMWGATLANPSVPGVYLQSPANEPAQVAWNLIRSVNPAITVENHGVGGTTCADLLWGNQSLGVQRSWVMEMAASMATIIVVNEGLNDGPARGETNEDFSWCYGQLWAGAVNQGKIFVIETPNPLVNDPSGRIAMISQMEHDVADEYGIFVIDQYSNIIANVVNWQSHLPDGIHPDAALYGYKARTALRLLTPMVMLFSQ